MTRALVVLLTAGLLLASSAQAKGPHAILTPGDDPAEAGRPWRVTLELMEFGRAVEGRAGRAAGEEADGRGAEAGPADFQDVRRYDVTLTFPSEGRWTLLALSGKRRFDFEAVRVGGGQVPPPYVAFAVGSRAEREGAGGVYYSSGEPVPGGRRRVRSRRRSSPWPAEDGGRGRRRACRSGSFRSAGVVLAGAGAAQRGDRAEGGVDGGLDLRDRRAG